MPSARDSADLSRAHDAALAAIILAIDPVGLGGVSLRGRAGGSRDAWLSLLGEFLPKTICLRRLPAHITDDRLLGGLDLGATLAAGRPIVERGVLANADGGLLLLPLAERMSPATAARIAAAMDKGEVAMERDGLTQYMPARFGIIALDEGTGEEEHPPTALLDRFACHVDLAGIEGETIREDEIAAGLTADAVTSANERLNSISAEPEAVEALCSVAAALGIGSLNAPLLALKAARSIAALYGRSVVEDEDVAAAARLVLAPRAMTVPTMDHEEAEHQPPEREEQQQPPEQNSPDQSRSTTPSDAELQEIVLAAARAAIPPGLLARLIERKKSRALGTSSGSSGQHQRTLRRGRPIGVRRGELRGGERLNILETLRAAAPWQRLRNANQSARKNSSRRIEVRSEDFRIKRLKDRRETVTVFVVDASGSSALNRLAEAKGAVELLLADCYVRRDEVALLSFGGRGVELLLPPTRSLTRAKRCLADLPGGGGTPLAQALEQAALLAANIKRKHQTPSIVVLTDGRPNVARDGSRSRDGAEHDAIDAARIVRETGVAVLLIDTSQRTQSGAQRFAEAMGAQYVPLPFADAQMLSEEVKSRLGH